MLDTDHITTEGIIIRLVRYRTERLMVTLLTPDAEIVTASFSTRQQKYQLDNLQRVSFTAAKKGDFFVVRDLQIADDFAAFGRDLHLFGYANYFAELTTRSFGGGAEPFQLLAGALNALAAAKSKPAFCRWFEYHIIRINGTAPQLDECVFCAKRLTDDAIHLFYEAGGAACRECSGGRARQAHRITSRAALNALKTLAATELNAAAALGDFESAVAKELSLLLRNYIQYKLAITTKSAKVFADILALTEAARR